MPCFSLSRPFGYRTYFVPGEASDRQGEDEHTHVAVHSVAYHAALLLAYLLPVVVLSQNLAVPLEYGASSLGAPVALSGLLVALLIVSPEAMSGLRAAGANRLQRSVNIYLGSVAATIGLTVPAALIIGLVTGRAVTLGLDPALMVLLFVTLGVSVLTFVSRRTNVLHGAVHSLLFFAYILLVFD